MKLPVIIPKFNLSLVPSHLNGGANKMLHQAMQLLANATGRRPVEEMAFFPLDYTSYLDDALELIAGDSHSMGIRLPKKDAFVRNPVASNSVYTFPGTEVYLVHVLVWEPVGAGQSWYIAVPTKGGHEKITQRLWKFLSSAVEVIRKKRIEIEKERDAKRKTVLDRIILPEEQRDMILKEVDSFVKSEKVYKELGLPWKRGMVLYGPPGNGKTLLLRSLADYFALNIRDMSGDMHEGEVAMPRSLYSNEPPIAVEKATASLCVTDVFDFIYPEKRRPILYYIEDMDKIMPGNNGSDIPKVRLGALLNTIDGINKLDGVLFVATTNHADSLAEAVMSRPGRFDSLYEIGLPNEKQIQQMLRLHKLTVDGKEPTDIAKELVGYSMAFAEEYVKIAKVIYHASDLTQVQAREILKRIHDHNKKYRSSFKKSTGMGFTEE